MPADKIREAAQQLVSEWVPAARDWYLRSLLPAIEADPSLARDHERAALSDIRRFGPSSNLVSLAAEAMPASPVDETTRVRFEMLTGKLRLLIAQNRGDRAADLYEMFTGAASVGSLDELLRFVKAGRTIQKLREQVVEALRSRARRALEKGDFAVLEQMAKAGGVEEEAAEAELASVARQAVLWAFRQGDAEKEKFLSTLSQAVLLKARAGSGKTAAIAMKVAMLCRHFRIDPARVMVLAFNTKAASEIGGRIRKSFGIGGFANARTFHSLAWQIARPAEELLYDASSGEGRGKLSTFVGDVLRSIWTDEIERQIYSYFRCEIAEYKALGENLSDCDYYIFVRNLRHISLKGDEVKSAAEKWIADFLFEHDLPYEYERPYFWDKRIYRPDFTIFATGKETVLEHWGIDPDATDGAVPRDWTRDWGEYREEIERKRRYWAQDRCGSRLIETCIRHMIHGREAFEAMLKRRLQEAGIRCERLDDAEIARRVRREQEPRLVRMLVQFISKAKKAVMSPADVARAIAESPAVDSRTASFESIASRVYIRYQEECLRQGKMDFDDLLSRCIRLIHETGGQCSLPVGGRAIPVRDIGWLLIDEYQDFSEAFRRMTDALRRTNPNLRVTCVGDDWQAINGFAGSDLKFFRDFAQLFSGGKVVSLLTNRRSASRIVDYGNQVMAGKGEPARPAPGRVGGEVAVENLENVWIELRREDEHVEARDGDSRFLSAASGLQGDAKLVYAKLLKRCHQEITAHPGSDFLLLARTNHLQGVRLTELGPRLKTCFAPDEFKALGRFEETVRVMTVHKSKGLEADHVIVLDAVRHRYPLLHSDEPLYRLFGKGYGSALEEERRLFYVACSRARRGLLLLTEKDNESDFIV